MKWKGNLREILHRNSNSMNSSCMQVLSVSSVAIVWNELKEALVEVASEVCM